MLDRADKIRLVAKLQRMTVDGDLGWAYADAPDVSDDVELLSERYEAEWDGIEFRVYRVSRERAARSESDWIREQAKFSGSLRMMMHKEWTDRYVLDVYDKKAERLTDSITDFEGVNPVKRLFATVRSRLTDVDDRLRHLIDDSVPSVISSKS